MHGNTLRMKARRLVLCLGLIIVLAGAVAHAAGEDVKLWPIYRHEDTEEQRVDDVLWPLWTSRTHKPSGHTVRGVVWPLGRFSSWDASGKFNHYIFPVFWGDRGDRYFFAVPVYWWWTDGSDTHLFVPPVYRSRSPDSSAWAVIPLFFRSVGPDSTVTALAPAWNSRGPHGHSFGVLPLFWHNHDTLGATGSYTNVLLLGNFRNKPDSRNYSVVPIFWHSADRSTTSTILVPAWVRRDTSGNLSIGLFPAFHHSRWTGSDAGVKTGVLLLAGSRRDMTSYHHYLFPLIDFSGDRELEKERAMVFPFFWGKTPTNSYAFLPPVVWSREHESGRYDGLGVLPFYLRWRGIDYDGLFALDDIDIVPPLWGRNRGPGDDRGWFFVAYPLFVRSKDARTRTWMPFPFIGTSRMPSRRDVWFWPVMSWTRDHKTESTRWSALFSLLGYRKNPSGTSQWFFPVYNYRHSESSGAGQTVWRGLLWLFHYEKRQSVLHWRFFPLADYTRRMNGNDNDVTWNVLILLLNGTRSATYRRVHALAGSLYSGRECMSERWTSITPFYSDRMRLERKSLDEPGRQIERTNVLFPLTYYRRRAADESATGGAPTTVGNQLELALLDPLALLDDAPNVARHYSALFHLIDYRRTDDGRRDFRLLWHDVHHTVDGDRRSLELFPFIESERTPDSRLFAFGWRLLRYERTGGEKSLRLFFLPAVRWGGAEAAPTGN